jgi:hypothetical protein
MPYPTVAHQEITLQVQEDFHDAIDSWELTEFLYLLRAAYARALQLDLHDPEDVIRDEFYLQQQFKKSFVLPTMAEKEVSELFSTDLGEDELRFRRISYSSPIEMTCICLASALTLAVILSGGKAGFMGFRFTLPPLGTGIKSLREALGLPSSTRRRRLK